MMPEIPKMPGEDFINSSYPILISIVLGIIIGIRLYMRGKRCPSEARVVGKTAIVTGANCGIGFEIAKNLAFRGARVILACRDEVKGNAALDEIKKSFGDHASVRFMKLDLASLASVREFASEFCASETQLDILINNAGIMCHPLERTVDGNELHFQTNYLGHFLLTHLLLEKLKAAPGGGRIVNLTANAYKLGELDTSDLQFEQREYKAGDAYSQSKLAVMLFTYELAKRLQDSKVTVNVANPGVVRTSIHRHMPFRQNFMVSLTFAPFLWFLMKTAFDGAQTPIYLAVAAEEEGVSGKTFYESKISDVEQNAVDQEKAIKLWDASMQLCGLVDSPLQ